MKHLRCGARGLGFAEPAHLWLSETQQHSTTISAQYCSFSLGWDPLGHANQRSRLVKNSWDPGPGAQNFAGIHPHRTPVPGRSPVQRQPWLWTSATTAAVFAASAWFGTSATIEHGGFVDAGLPVKQTSGRSRAASRMSQLPGTHALATPNPYHCKKCSL